MQVVCDRIGVRSVYCQFVGVWQYSAIGSAMMDAQGAQFRIKYRMAADMATENQITGSKHDGQYDAEDFILTTHC